MHIDRLHLILRVASLIELSILRSFTLTFIVLHLLVSRGWLLSQLALLVPERIVVVWNNRYLCFFFCAWYYRVLLISTDLEITRLATLASRPLCAVLRVIVLSVWAPMPIRDSLRSLGFLRVGTRAETGTLVGVLLLLLERSGWGEPYWRRSGSRKT